MNSKRQLLFISFFLFVSLLLQDLGYGQKTVTKAAKKEAIKRRKHEEALRKAMSETQKIKDRNRKETKSNKIKKLVDEHMKNAKSARFTRLEL